MRCPFDDLVDLVNRTKIETRVVVISNHRVSFATSCLTICHHTDIESLHRWLNKRLYLFEHIVLLGSWLKYSIVFESPSPVVNAYLVRAVPLAYQGKVRHQTLSLVVENRPHSTDNPYCSLHLLNFVLELSLLLLFLMEDLQQFLIVRLKFFVFCFVLLGFTQSAEFYL